MGIKDLEKSTEKLDRELNNLVIRLEDAHIEARKSSRIISKKSPKARRGYGVKGFFKWLFTEFF